VVWCCSVWYELLLICSFVYTLRGWLGFLEVYVVWFGYFGVCALVCLFAFA